MQDMYSTDRTQITINTVPTVSPFQCRSIGSTGTKYRADCTASTRQRELDLTGHTHQGSIWPEGARSQMDDLSAGWNLRHTRTPADESARTTAVGNKGGGMGSQRPLRTPLKVQSLFLLLTSCIRIAIVCSSLSK